MIKAVRTNKDIKIISFDSPSDEGKISEALTVSVPNYIFTKAYKSGAWNGKYTFYNNYAKTFPSGLMAILPEEVKNRFVIVDQRNKPDFLLQTPELNGVELRDYQLKIVEEAISKENAIVSAPCGSGKTEMAAAIIKSIPVTIIWLTHRASLLTQTKQRLEMRLGQRCGILMGDECDLQRVTVAMVQTLYNRIHSNDNKEKAFFVKWLKNAEMLFLDECHHASSTTWYRLARLSDAYFRFGLSATPLYGDDISNYKLMAVTGEEIKVIGNQDLVERGLSALPVIYRINNEIHTFINSRNYGFVYKIGVEQNDNRNALVAAAVKKHVAKNEPVLVLVTRINHGKIIRSKLADIDNVYFLSGSTPVEERDRILRGIDTGEVKVIIATQIFDEGIDAPNVRALVLAGAGRSWRELLQRLGRGMRRKSEGENKIFVYDFADKGEPFLEEHSKHRLKLYKKEGFSVINLPPEAIFEVAENEKL